MDVTVRDPDTGETVTLTVRELRFLEGLRFTATVRAFIEALAGSCSGAGDEIDESVLAAAMTDHAAAWIAGLALAIGRDADWLGRLSDADGQALSVAMWDVNGGFFGRRFIDAVRRRKKQAGSSPSPRSSTPSSGPATDTDTATSPSV